jgi:hypothetical protein
MLVLFGPKAFAAVTVGLGLALKCIAIAVTLTTGYILHQCSAPYYLCRSQPEDELPVYFVSQGTPRTLAVSDAIRCRGPGTKKQLEEWAAADNASIATNGPSIMVPFPCGPLGTIPGPAPTPVRMTLQQSTDGGRSWANLATLDTDTDETCPFGLLPATGTNGMTRAQVLEYAGCATNIVNTAGAQAIYRVLF